MLQHLSVNGQIVDIQHELEHLLIPQKYLVIGRNQITIDFIAGDLSLNRNDDYLYTLLVPDRARTLFPCFDQPNIKANYKLSIRVPKDWTVLAGATLNTRANDGVNSTFIFNTSDLMSTYLLGTIPFKTVYLHGLVRDDKGKKMSKSLGNSPDALKLIENFGADGVRVGLLLSSAAGNDLMFDEALCQQGKAFGNKIWNAFRLIDGWQVAEVEQPDYAAIGIEWYQAKFQKTLIEIEDHFSKYRLSDALMTTYKLIWDDFCSWLLEIVKPAYETPIDQKTYRDVVTILESNLKILHPFMPFLTEEIWQFLEERKPEQALIVASWPEQESYDQTILEGFEFASDVVSGIRSIRKEKNIAFKNRIEFLVLNNESQSTGFDAIISKIDFQKSLGIIK